MLRNVFFTYHLKDKIVKKQLAECPQQISLTMRTSVEDLSNCYNYFLVSELPDLFGKVFFITFEFF